MPRVSPAVGRMVAILNFLADHPKQAFTLTDLVRALKLSRATCHALLSGLVEAGYLYRTADKAYILGRALTRIGRVAGENLSLLQVVGPEMRALADEFDAICAAIFREGDHAVVKERAVSLSHIGWAIPVLGTKASIRPPLGGVFFAWSSEAEIKRWLASAKTELTAEERTEIEGRLNFVRANGYVFDIRKVPIMDEKHAQSLVLRVEQSEYIMGELIMDERYNLASLSAPVFDAEGKVAFALSLMGFTSAVPGSLIDHAGKSLRAACDRITQFNQDAVSRR